MVLVSIGTTGLFELFSFSRGFSAIVVICSAMCNVCGDSFVSVVLCVVGLTVIGGGTGVTTGLLFMGSLFTSKTLISPV